VLIQRILTAIILIPLTLAALFYSSPQVFCIITGLISLAAAWEWTNLMEIKKTWGRIFYLIIAAIIFLWILFIPVSKVLIVSFVWWLFATLLIVLYPRGSSWWGKSKIVRGIMGLMVLVPCWVAINYIRNEKDGMYALLFLFVLIWGADTAAYFVGKKWGTVKLAPSVSPGKSWQGLCGALIFSMIIVLVTVKLCHLPLAIWPWAFALSLITVMFSIVGDLFESMIKRQAGLKDSGKLLPGHGGLLDRIDSLTAAAPVFVLGGLLLGIYLG